MDSKRTKGSVASPLPLRLRNEPRFMWEAVSVERGDEHPVDRAVENVRAVAILRRKVRRAHQRLERAGLEPKLRVHQQDCELEYRLLRENLYFDAGYAFGLVAGRSERPLTQGARRLARDVRTAALLAQLTPQEAVAALLESTRALSAGLMARRGRR